MIQSKVGKITIQSKKGERLLATAMYIAITISLILLLILSGFFSAAETSLLSIDKIKLKNRVQKGEKKALKIENLLERPEHILSTILIGNNIVNILASALATSLFSSVFGSYGVAISTAVMTILVLIFGEITPKTLAQKFPYKTAKTFVTPLYFLKKVFRPAVYLMTFITKIILTIFKVDTHNINSSMTEEELRMIVELSEQSGNVKDYERNLIHNIFEFDDIAVKEIMIPRIHMVAISIDSSYQDVIDISNQYHYSRLPIYENHVDNIVGVLYLKDLLFIQIDDPKTFTIKNYIRKPLFVSEFTTLHHVFKEMQKRKVHLSIIVDEYGGTSGMTTMEDLIEEVLGDIEDEFDFEEDEIIQLSDNVFMLDAKVKISHLNETLSLHLPEDTVTSLSGFIYEQIGKVPLLSQKVIYQNLIFVVEEMDQFRLRKVRLIIKKDHA